MALFGPFVDKVGPAISAAFMNALDALQNVISATSAGNVTFAPTSGVALTLVPVSGSDGLDITANLASANVTSRLSNTSTATNSNVEYILSGNNGAVLGGVFLDGLGTVYPLGVYLRTLGNQASGLVTNNKVRLYATGAGQVTVNTPDSGTALLVTGLANSYAATFAAPNTAGQSFGLVIKAGTNATDAALLIQDPTGTNTYLEVAGNAQISGPFVPITLVRQANLTRASTTTFTDDPNMVIANLPLGFYRIQTFFNWQTAGDGSQGFKWQAASSGAFTVLTGTVTRVVNSVFTARNYNLGITAQYGTIANSGNPTDWDSFDSVFQMTTAGTFSIQWAQNTSNAVGTQLSAGSYAVITRLA